MNLNRDIRERRKRLNMEPGLDGIIDRMNMERNAPFSLEVDNIINWVPEEAEPEIIDEGDSLAITLGIPQTRSEEIELSMGKNFVSVEITQQDFKKEIGLPHEVAYKGSRATYKNGVLDMVLRKAK